MPSEANGTEQEEATTHKKSGGLPKRLRNVIPSWGTLGRFAWLIFAIASVAAVLSVESGYINDQRATDILPEVTEQSPDDQVEQEIDLSGSLPISLEQLAEYHLVGKGIDTSVLRKVDLHTVFPERQRIEISKYTVKEGDTLFGIGDQYNLKPDTILWGNWYTLGGDPHTLRPGQELNILPVDGVLHIWTAGEGLNGVAKFYRVTPEDIINWAGNELDSDIDRANPPIEEGTRLVIPGGRRDPPSWQMIQITRSDPAVAQVLGPGYCGAISGGLIGDGVFGWPTDARWLSGYHYMPGIHEAIDIGGSVGVPIMASDDGVVVYSGWNDWGYGYVVVLDHGTGWQTLYAHLSSINLGCGQSASQGQVIGAMGCTGNCSGPHLHFEMRHEVWGRVNPIDMLP
jgi:murein DD-endopeptidase MepM/ murein hydrolase activator NlpD